MPPMIHMQRHGIPTTVQVWSNMINKVVTVNHVSLYDEMQGLTVHPITGDIYATTLYGISGSYRAGLMRMSGKLELLGSSGIYSTGGGGSLWVTGTLITTTGRIYQYGRLNNYSTGFVMELGQDGLLIKFRLLNSTPQIYSIIEDGTDLIIVSQSSSGSQLGLSRIDSDLSVAVSYKSFVATGSSNASSVMKHSNGYIYAAARSGAGSLRLIKVSPGFVLAGDAEYQAVPVATSPAGISEKDNGHIVLVDGDAILVVDPTSLDMISHHQLILTGGHTQLSIKAAQVIGDELLLTGQEYAVSVWREWIATFNLTTNTIVTHTKHWLPNGKTVTMSRAAKHGSGSVAAGMYDDGTITDKRIAFVGSADNSFAGINGTTIGDVGLYDDSVISVSTIANSTPGKNQESLTTLTLPTFSTHAVAQEAATVATDSVTY